MGYFILYKITEVFKKLKSFSQKFKSCGYLVILEVADLLGHVLIHGGWFHNQATSICCPATFLL